MPVYIILLIFIASIIILYFLIRFFVKKPEIGEYKETKEKWEEIKNLMKNESVLSFKLAVIEADKLFDSALKEARMRGDTMGERLRFAVHKYPKIQKIWEAHILRNDLVHERDRALSRGEAEKALSLFYDGLKIIKAL